MRLYYMYSMHCSFLAFVSVLEMVVYIISNKVSFSTEHIYLLPHLMSCRLQVLTLWQEAEEKQNVVTS